MKDEHGKNVPEHIEAVLWPQIQSDGTVCLVVPDLSTYNVYFRNKRYARQLKIPFKYVEGAMAKLETLAKNRDTTVD